MKEGTQDIDLHARGTACPSALTTSVGKLKGFKDIIEGLFGSYPKALMAMPAFFCKKIRTYFSLDRWATFCPLTSSSAQ